MSDASSGSVGERESGRIRVVLADDHALFRRGLRQLLQGGGFDVIGEASNGRAAVQLAVELQPDVLVVDMSMPIVDGIEATRAVARAAPGVRVIAFTVSEERDVVLDAFRAGARGFMLKDSPVEEIRAGITAAARGETPISPRVATLVVERLLELVSKEPAPAAEAVDLTARELEILRLIAAGQDNVAIAATLFLSPKTVKNHVHHILGKLGLRNRAEAAAFAVRHGLS